MRKRKLKLQYQNRFSKNYYYFAKKHLRFRFNGEIYTQIDGVAMGSPLGPLLANIFMISLEEKVLPKVPNYYIIGNVMLMTLTRMLLLKRLILF